MRARWEWGAARVGDTFRLGWFWRCWLVGGGKGNWTVYHLPSGGRVTEFSDHRLVPRKLAKQFCEEIDALADWSTPVIPGRDIQRQMHRIALRLTQGRPDLHIVPS
jgi:hypothetical protein